MFRLTFAQMRRSMGRLTAAGIAIAIGSAFVAVTLLAGNLITRTAYDSISASYGKADLVIRQSSDSWTLPPETKTHLDDQDVEKILEISGVDAVLPSLRAHEKLEGPNKSEYQFIAPTSSDERLNSLEVTDGRLPTADDEIALDADRAERFGAGVGDTVTVVVTTYAESDGALVEDADGFAEAPDLEEVRFPLTVVGLVKDPNGAFAMYGGASLSTVSAIKSWSVDADEFTYDEATIALASGTDAAATISTIDSLLDAPGLVVQTRDAAAQESAKNFTGGQDVLTKVVLGFAALALLVAGLVISNTFQVLVAQRTRTLAMLRCIGAKKRQLRMSVRLEAAILAIVSSVVGIVLGCLFGQGTLLVLGRLDLGAPIPSTISVTPDVIWLPMLAALIVTLVAAMAPATAATRVSPLAALRPAEPPSVRRGGIPRLVLSILLMVGGFALLAGGIVLAQQDSSGFALLVGIAGGALSFVGIVIGAVFWLPKVTGLVGKLLAKSGASGKLAAANTVRNPRRTAATSTALLIGVTLVVMMSTGAISARQTLNEELDESFPVDVQATSYYYYSPDPGDFGNSPAISPELRSEVAAVTGVEATLPVYLAGAVVNGSDQPEGVMGLDPQGAAKIMRAPHLIEALTDSTVLMTSSAANGYGVKEGDTLTLAPAGTSGAEPLSLKVVIGTPLGGLTITSANAAALDPEPVTSELWIKLGTDADPNAAIADIQEVFGDNEFWVTGAAVERAVYETVIDVLLAVVLGLLAVAVVIALIGVANTLSLSVIERQRENAMLRAIGLSRRQLRVTLAIEGILIALVGTALGVVLGLVYGWAGAITAFGNMGDVVLAVPWTEIGIALLVALVAGLLASVLPARRAARTSPVEALAVD